MRLLAGFLFCISVASLRAEEKPELVLQNPRTGYVNWLRFSADGKTLAVAGNGKAISLWDVATGLVCRTLPKGEEPFKLPRSAQEVQDLRAGKGWRGGLPSGVVLPEKSEEGQTNITLSPDGRYLVHIHRPRRDEEESGTCVFSDAKTGKILWRRSLEIVHGVSISPDARWLALSSRDNKARSTIQFCRAGDGRLQGIITIGEDSLARGFTADSQYFYGVITRHNQAGGETAKHFYLWRVPDGKLVTVSAPQDLKQPVPILRVPPSRAGRLYLTHRSGQIAAYNALTGRALWQQKTALRSPRALEISPDGRTLALGEDTWPNPTEFFSLGLRIELRDAHSGRLIRAFGGSAYPVGAPSIRVWPDGRLVSNDMMGRVFWNLKTGQPESEASNISAANAANASSASTAKIIDYTPDGKNFIQLAPNDNRTKMPAGWELRDAKTGELRGTFRVPTGGFSGTGGHYFSPDGRYLAVTKWTDVTGRGSFGVFEAQNGKGMKGFQSQGISVADIAFSRDGKWLASAHIDGTVNLYSLSDGVLQGRLLGVQSRLNAITFTPDGHRLITAAADGVLRIWDVQTQSVTRQWQAHRRAFKSPYTGEEFSEGGIKDLAFSPDDHFLVTGGGDGTAKVWDFSDGKLVHTLPHQFAVQRVTFLPDGALATSADDGALRLWNVSTGKLHATLQRLPSVAKQILTWIAFTPEGYYDGSPDIEKFMAWRQGETIFPASRFTSLMRRPDLVHAALQSQ
jgi:WD40 repeat protein